MHGIDKRISQHRERSGLSQLELSEMLDVSRQSISKWETGVAVPELPKLIKMAELFGVTLDELVLGEEGSEPAPVREQTGYVKPAEAVTAKSEQRLSTGNIIWGVFFLFAGFVLSMVLCIMFSEPTMLIVFIPFAFSAFCFLKQFTHAWLWCADIWFLLVSGWLYYGTGTSWTLVFDKRLYSSYESTWLGVFSWIEFILLILLISATVFAYRNKEFHFSKAKNITLASVCGASVIFRIASRYISPFIGTLLWGISEEKTVTYVVNGVVHTVYEQGWLESKWDILSLFDFSVDIIILIIFTFCLVPTFYWVMDIRSKKK